LDFLILDRFREAPNGASPGNVTLAATKKAGERTGKMFRLFLDGHLAPARTGPLERDQGGAPCRREDR